MANIAFGEILFDVFPSGVSKLGGAPLNTLVNLKRLDNRDSYIVSSLGKDSSGRVAMYLIKGYGIKTVLIGSSKYPTAISNVKIDEGKNVDYIFNEPNAFDDIEISDENLAYIGSASFDSFIYGTLSMRSEKSLETFKILDERVKSKIRVFDINLRKKFYSKEVFEVGLKRATILKLNQDEEALFKSEMGLSDNWREWLFSQYRSLSAIIITKDSDGVDVYTREGKIQKKAKRVEDVVDTVGAGDSFTSAFVYALIEGADFDKAVDAGVELSSYVVSKEGAIPDFEDGISSRIKKAIRS